jgi:hypothetical protein
LNCGVRVGRCYEIGRQIQKIRSSSKNFTELAEAKRPLKLRYSIQEKNALGDFKTVTTFHCIVSKAVFNLSLGYVHRMSARQVVQED